MSDLELVFVGLFVTKCQVWLELLFAGMFVMKYQIWYLQKSKEIFEL